MLCKKYLCAFCNFEDSSDNLSTKLEECQDCHLVRYCGDDCQRQHWPKHKEICQKRQSDLEALYDIIGDYEIASDICGQIEDQYRRHPSPSEVDKQSEEHEEKFHKEYDEVETKQLEFEKRAQDIIDRLVQETLDWAEEKQDYHLFEKTVELLIIVDYDRAKNPSFKRSSRSFSPQHECPSEELSCDKTYKTVCNLLYLYFKLGWTNYLEDYDCGDSEFFDVETGVADLFSVILKSGFPEVNGPFVTFQDLAISAPPRRSPLNELYAKGIPMDTIKIYYQQIAEEEFERIFETDRQKYTASYEYCKDPWQGFKCHWAARHFLNVLCGEPDFSPLGSLSDVEETKYAKQLAERFRDHLQRDCPKLYAYLCKAWRLGREEEYSEYNGSDEEYKDSKGVWHHRPPKRRRRYGFSRERYIYNESDCSELSESDGQYHHDQFHEDDHDHDDDENDDDEHSVSDQSISDESINDFDLI